MEYPTLPLLRDRTLPTAAFRAAARPIIHTLIDVLHQHLSNKNAEQNVVFVIILRAGLAFLDTAIERFPSALVASAGLRRDEETAQAQWYYRNFPPLSRDHTAVILDPMLATGGSAIAVVQELRRCGLLPHRIHFAGLLGAPEGLAALSEILPRENILLATIDEGLDMKKFIVPGLGDFGDRYFGYVPLNSPLSSVPGTPRTPAATALR